MPVGDLGQLCCSIHYWSIRDIWRVEKPLINISFQNVPIPNKSSSSDQHPGRAGTGWQQCRDRLAAVPMPLSLSLSKSLLPSFKSDSRVTPSIPRQWSQAQPEEDELRWSSIAMYQSPRTSLPEL